MVMVSVEIDSNWPNFYATGGHCGIVNGFININKSVAILGNDVVIQEICNFYRTIWPLQYGFLNIKYTALILQITTLLQNHYLIKL